MSTLNYILSKKYDETYTISFIATDPQQVNDSGAVFKTDVIKNISSIKSFSDEVEGETSETYFTKLFKYKQGDNWSEMLPISNITGLTLDHCSDFQLELYYYRTVDGRVTNTPLYINNIIMSGDYQLSEYESEALIENNGDTVLLKPKDIYKIFSLSDFNVYSDPHNSYEIKYRFTQDNSRTYTPWEQLTKENLSTVKLNPLRFSQVEYSITNTSTQPLMVYDVILIGDFQNVSANYLKTNRYGLKQDCLTSLKNTPGAPGSDNVNKDFYTSCIGSYSQYGDVSKEIALENSNNTANMWNPYQFDKITSFANTLANQVSKIFGWTVDYHLTDPDSNGIDKYIHEYTLKNIVDMQKIKVVVPDNKFPIETLIVNQFNMDLFDTFEIHIIKDEFKNAFGITKRPSEDDIIYICEANMLFIVKHAQQLKSIMNSATYYKVILEKYEYKTNIRNTVQESQDRINALTDNTTIESLFSDDNMMEENKIANKEQFYPTSFDKIRHKISTKVNIIKEDVIVDNFDIIKQYYDLSYKTIKDKTAVNYTKVDQNVKKSDNRSFILWTNFNNSYNVDAKPTAIMANDYNIKSGVEFNLLNNYSTSNTGYKIYYQGDSLYFKFNNVVHKLTQQLLTNIWYAFVINFNQRQQTLDIHIYRRETKITTTLFDINSYIKQDAEYQSVEYNNLIANGFKPLTNTEEPYCNRLQLVTSQSYSILPDTFSHIENLLLLGSNIKYSNLRILDEVIPQKSIENILKQNIIKDAQHLILGDNATKQLITRYDFNKNFR